jgi:hypothetical protein
MSLGADLCGTIQRMNRIPDLLSDVSMQPRRPFDATRCPSRLLAPAGDHGADLVDDGGCRADAIRRYLFRYELVEQVAAREYPRKLCPHGGDRAGGEEQVPADGQPLPRVRLSLARRRQGNPDTGKPLSRCPDAVAGPRFIRAGGAPRAASSGVRGQRGCRSASSRCRHGRAAVARRAGRRRG